MAETETPAAPAVRIKEGEVIWGTGRRKSSVARVRLMLGTGRILVNHRTIDEFFPGEKERISLLAPLKAVDGLTRYDVLANVRGGGFTGQSGALRLGIARALRQAEENVESRGAKGFPVLEKVGLPPEHALARASKGSCSTNRLPGALPMPYCPNCEEEFEEGMSACVNCGADLVDSPLYDEDGEDLAAFETVFVGPMAVAFEIKTHLDNQGFPVYMQGAEESHGIGSAPTDRTGIVRILVPIEAADTATEIIEDLTAKEKGEGAEEGLPFGEDEAILDEGFEGEESVDAGDEDLAEPGVFAESASAGEEPSPRKAPRKKSGRKTSARKKAVPRDSALSGKKTRADRKNKNAKRAPRGKPGGKKENATKRRVKRP
jgi:small subunit ribosomal protein S9